jgi:hypothetical protein
MPSLSRSETISLLASLGVDVPSHSKLPDASLKQRLSKALNATQQLSTVLPRAVLDPSVLQRWDPTRESAHEAVRRSNMMEASANVLARAQGRLNFTELGENPFMDVRQTLMVLGRMWDSGITGALMEDANESRGMILRVRSSHLVWLLVRAL